MCVPLIVGGASILFGLVRIFRWWLVSRSGDKREVLLGGLEPVVRSLRTASTVEEVRNRCTFEWFAGMVGRIAKADKLCVRGLWPTRSAAAMLEGAKEDNLQFIGLGKAVFINGRHVSPAKLAEAYGIWADRLRWESTWLRNKATGEVVWATLAFALGSLVVGLLVL